MTAQIKVRTDLREQRVGEEVMVFDESTDQVHVLNVTSAFVWDCLKDTASSEEIVTRIRREFSTDEDEDVDSLVARALSQLAERGLIQYEP